MLVYIIPVQTPAQLLSLLRKQGLPSWVQLATSDK